MRLRRASCGAAAAALVFVTGAAARSGHAWSGGIAVVGYRSGSALAAALARHPARIVRRLPALGVAEVRPAGDPGAFAREVRALPGIAYVEQRALRLDQAEPAIAPSFSPGGAFEWQYAAVKESLVPPWVLRAAADITIATVDTGADVSVPDLAAKIPGTHSITNGGSDVTDSNGHGTFVASLAAGSVSNDEGMAGFGGDAKLLIVQANNGDSSFSDVDEAAAIVYAIDHGARVINLSLGGPDTSRTERNAIDYAATHGVLLVAAAGNEADRGSPVEYPAALLQPAGSNGVGGRGLAVGASTLAGTRASFSNSGSYVSLAAPGVNVLGALASSSSPGNFPRVAIPGTQAGLYGFGSGTSYASPEVAGAAALVWAANPTLAATDVAQILKDTASGAGMWSADLGYGVIDVAAAVARAGGQTATPAVRLAGSRNGRRVRLSWAGEGVTSYRLSVREDGAFPRVLLSGTLTKAAFALSPGHTYVFTVDAVDEAGNAVATSAPYRVSVGRPGWSVTLRVKSMH